GFPAAAGLQPGLFGAGAAVLRLHAAAAGDAGALGGRSLQPLGPAAAAGHPGAHRQRGTRRRRGSAARRAGRPAGRWHGRSGLRRRMPGPAGFRHPGRSGGRGGSAGPGRRPRSAAVRPGGGAGAAAAPALCRAGGGSRRWPGRPGDVRARPAQCLPGLAGPRRYRAGPGAVRQRRHHDRTPGGAARAAAPPCAGRGHGAGGFPRALRRRSAGDRQVDRAGGHPPGRRHPGRCRRPAGLLLVEAGQPEPGAGRAGQSLARQSAGLPSAGWRRLPAAGRADRRAGRGQSAGGRPPAGRLRSLAPADAGPARRGPPGAGQPRRPLGLPRLPRPAGPARRLNPPALAQRLNARQGVEPQPVELRTDSPPGTKTAVELHGGIVMKRLLALAAVLLLAGCATTYSGGYGYGSDRYYDYYSGEPYYYDDGYGYGYGGDPYGWDSSWSFGFSYGYGYDYYGYGVAPFWRLDRYRCGYWPYYDCYSHWRPAS